MNVAELERRMLEIIPASVAEPWDRTGMLVGNPGDEVRGVAVALDPTCDAIAFARRVGANVLVTHHPLFLDPPTQVKPAAYATEAVGARIWEAVKSGVSVMSFHTALDASPLAAGVLAAPLGLGLTGEVLEEVAGHPGCGYGRLCTSTGTSVGEIAEACAASFGHAPRIWGDAHAVPSRVCLWTGAAGESPLACLAQDVDLLVCGEVKYHMALDAAELGLCIIELGHDVSEQVHCPVLVESLQKCGVDGAAIRLMDLPANWH